MNQKLSIAVAVTFAALGLTSNANADLIITLGQSGSGSTVTGTENGGLTQTTITALNVPVTITQIDAALTTPLSAFLDLNATSTGAASLVGSPQNVQQNYSGTFSITSLSGDTGTNYLSGTFMDAVFGNNLGAALTLNASDPTEVVTFTSDVITALAVPTALAFSFANVSPAVQITGSSLASFNSSVSGTLSGSPVPVPEPASIAVLGSALVGVGFTLRRRQTLRP